MSPNESHVLVSEVWQLALPPGTTLAGGKDGLSRPVEWAASLRSAFPLFGSLGKGFLALARLGVARQLDAQLTPAYLIDELHRAQAAAFVVDEPISTADGQLADRLSLPVLVLPPGSDLHEVERDILRTLIDHEGQIARREAEARQRLQQLLAQGGIQAVLDELARVTASTVLLTDKSDISVGFSGLDQAVPEPSEAFYPIRVAGRPLGMLLVRTSAARKNPLDAVYARQAAEMCGIEMLERLARQETEERLGADLVEQLLDATLDKETIAARFQRLGYELAAPRRHVVMALGRAASGTMGAITQARESTCYDVARDVQWAAQRDDASVVLVPYRERLLVFCAFSVAERSVRTWLQEAFAKSTAERCAAGVSRVVEGLAGLRVAVTQACDALDLGRRISGRKSPHYYEELGLYRLLAGLRARDELKRFYDETLGTLVSYDLAHGTELVRTLEAFFDENANASQTSRALYVHRNTLSYRLQRIVEITGLDLNDADARLAFQLALKVHHLDSTPMVLAD